MNIYVKNLSKSFGKQLAVDSISFSAKEGRILGILGPNGAGKTTTMRMLSCFLNADSGEVFYNETNINKHSRKIKNMIGYLSENNTLYGDMNVIDFLYFVAKIHDIPKYKITARIMDMLRLCGLEDEKHKYIRELSKGYKQRLGIAQTLIHDPKVLLLDESTNGLDPKQTSEIWNLIKNISSDKTIIMSSHVLDDIEAICDDVVILNKGKVVINASMSELQTKNKEFRQILVELVGDNRIYEKLSDIEGVLKVEERASNIFEIEVIANVNIEKEIFDLCVDNSWYIKNMKQIEESLEDIFKKVTGY